MMKHAYLIAFCILLSACQQAAENARAGVVTARDKVFETYEHVLTYIDLPPYQPPSRGPVTPTYCYKHQMDTVCYDRPQEGMGNLMVGRQPVPGSKAYDEMVLEYQTRQAMQSMQMPPVNQPSAPVLKPLPSKKVSAAPQVRGVDEDPNEDLSDVKPLF